MRLFNLKFIQRRRWSSIHRHPTAPTFQLVNNSLKVKWPGSGGAGGIQNESQFHYVWLRDSCPCAKCIHPSTRQKLHSSSDIPINVEPRSVNVLDSEHLVVDWNGDVPHQSVFSWQWLREHCYSMQKTERHKALTGDVGEVLWNNAILDHAELKIGYQNFLKDSDAFDQTLSSLQTYGIALLTDVPAELKIVEIIAQKFGPIRETFYGRSWDVKSEIDATNIASTSLSLGFHMDLMYFESPPGLQFLHCLSSSVFGGENRFVDSYKAVEIFRQSHPADFQLLTQIPITYHYINNDHWMRFKRPCIQIDGHNQKMTVSFAPPFQGPLEIDADQVVLFYQAFKKFTDIIELPSLRFEIRLEPGMCVIFANRRVLHSRTSFVQGKSGLRHLRGTYVDWDCFVDLLRMRRKLRH